jgi:hypothetical protein
MRIEYTATRNIKAGHTLGNSYELVHYAEAIEPGFGALRSVNYSLDGSRMEVDFRGIVETAEIRTDLILRGAATGYFEEFLQSVMAGEEFVLDAASDTAGVVVSPLTCKLTSDRYTREFPIPTYCRYAFAVRVV